LRAPGSTKPCAARQVPGSLQSLDLLSEATCIDDKPYCESPRRPITSSVSLVWLSSTVFSALS
jgi:hypothetical protein